MFIKNIKQKNKKNVYAFLMKKTPLYAGLGSKQKKLLATVKQLIKKNSVYCLKNQAIFFFTERTYR